jgi:hypothetical protein
VRWNFLTSLTKCGDIEPKTARPSSGCIRPSHEIQRLQNRVNSTRTQPTGALPRGQRFIVAIASPLAMRVYRRRSGQKPLLRLQSLPRQRVFRLARAACSEGSSGLAYLPPTRYAILINYCDFYSRITDLHLGCDLDSSRSTGLSALHADPQKGWPSNNTCLLKVSYPAH